MIYEQKKFNREKKKLTKLFSAQSTVGGGGGEALLPENGGNRIHIIAIGGSKVSLGSKTKPLDKMTSGTKTGKEGSKIKMIL